MASFSTKIAVPAIYRLAFHFIESGGSMKRDALLKLIPDLDVDGFLANSDVSVLISEENGFVVFEGGRASEVEARAAFARFRDSYKNICGYPSVPSADKAFLIFKKKCKDWRKKSHLLYDILQAQNRARLASRAEFMPRWRMLDTWLNQSGWEDEAVSDGVDVPTGDSAYNKYLAKAGTLGSPHLPYADFAIYVAWSKGGKMPGWAPNRMMVDDTIATFWAAHQDWAIFKKGSLLNHICEKLNQRNA